VAWDNSSRNRGADHIAIYIGNGQIIEAPRPGVPVRIRKLGKNERAWGVRLLDVPDARGPSTHFNGA
jgi:cell wall-associated NlpC family hydrolase